MRTVGVGLSAALAVAIVGFIVVPLMILSAPFEPVMGLVQKIFYFHVPCAAMLFLSTFVAAGGSVAYLFKGSERGGSVGARSWGVGRPLRNDHACYRSALGTQSLGRLVAMGCAIDHRAVAVPKGYLLARRYGGPGGRKLAAALALFAGVDVPLVYKSVDIWRTVHPQTTVVRTLDPRMRPAFWASFALIALVWGILLTLRMRLEEARATLADLKLMAEDQLEAGS